MKKLVILIILVMIYVAILSSINAKASEGHEAHPIKLGGFAKLYEEAGCPDYYEYLVTDDEKEILYRITEAEATGCTFEQKVHVCEAVMNRVISDIYPNNIKDVVFQVWGGAQQFSPISDGRYYTVAITDETVRAVEHVLINGVTHNATAFHSYHSKGTWHKSHMDFVFEDGAGIYYTDRRKEK